MKILLLGKNGQVGFELHRALHVIGSVYAPDSKTLDLRCRHSLQRFLQLTKPDLIVNAAAYTGVDDAEKNREIANRINTEVPSELAKYCASENIRLVHYSSDYVYPGSGIEEWNEECQPGPLNFYGLTKLEGDRAIERSGSDYLVFRTSWVYSARGKNFLRTMLRLAETKSELSVVADQVGSPTPARLIAQVTVNGLQARLESGLYHLAPRGATSWCDFARSIFDAAGIATTVTPIPTRMYPTPAKRPLNSRLSVKKLEQKLGIELPDWESQMLLTINELMEK